MWFAEDCNATGNFLLADAAGARTPVSYAPHEELAVSVDYESLRAFETADGRGWGACCATAIGKGDVVVEAIGCGARLARAARLRLSPVLRSRSAASCTRSLLPRLTLWERLAVYENSASSRGRPRC